MNLLQNWPTLRSPGASTELW